MVRGWDVPALPAQALKLSLLARGLLELPVMRSAKACPCARSLSEGEARLCDPLGRERTDGLLAAAAHFAALGCLYRGVPLPRHRRRLPHGAFITLSVAGLGPGRRPKG